jgi:MFS family permease
MTPDAAPTTPSPLADRTYRLLFTAQVTSLVGTGSSTVALGLLAYEIGGDHAGVVLGLALALKMVAYVGLSPVIAAYAHLVDRTRFLVGLDLARAAAMGVVPFVGAAWQVLALVFFVNACAAGFTPAFQAAIPDVLPDQERYTRALSLSRVAYDLGDLLSPVLAAGLLLLVDFRGLFVLDAVTFLVSAALVLAARAPRRSTGPVSDRTWKRIAAGVRRFGADRPLRGVAALNVAAAAGSAMVIVNTVVLVREDLGGTEAAVAVALAVSGAGSITAATLVPRLLRRVPERTVMLAGATGVGVGLLLSAATTQAYAGLLATWLVVGAGLSLVQTPIGRILQERSSREERPSVFAAQFSLSHACWLATYPIAGVLGTVVGARTIALVLGALALLAVAVAATVWPSRRRPRGAGADGLAATSTPGTGL